MDYKFYLSWCKAMGLDAKSVHSMVEFQKLNTQRDIVIRGGMTSLCG